MFDYAVEVHARYRRECLAGDAARERLAHIDAMGQAGLRRVVEALLSQMRGQEKRRQPASPQAASSLVGR